MPEEMLNAFWRTEAGAGGNTDEGGLKVEDQRHGEKGCLRTLRRVPINGRHAT